MPERRGQTAWPTDGQQLLRRLGVIVLWRYVICRLQDMAQMRLNASLLGLIAGWVWMLAAAGSGIWLLVTKGPWPPTNGWFALLSGLAACPLLAGVLKKVVGISVSGWLQFAVALLIFVAGHIALIIWPHQY